MNRRRGFWLGAAAVLLGLVLAVVSLAMLARSTGSGLVVQALERNSTAIGSALRIQFEKALSVGMALNDWVGVDTVFRDHLARHREVSFFALLDAEGRPILFVPGAQMGEAARAQVQQALVSGQAAADAPFQVTRTALASPPNGTLAVATPVGTLLTGYPRNYIDQQVNAVVVDLFVAVLIAVILVAEFLRYAGQRFAWGGLLRFRAFARHLSQGMLAVRSPLPAESPAGPAADRLGQLGAALNRRLDALRLRHTHALQHAARRPELLGRLTAWAERHRLHAATVLPRGLGDMAHLRLVVFLTALSDEMTRPFLAVHVANLDGPLALSNEVLAGIPLTTFLLTWALSQPFGAALLGRWGARRCLGGATALVGLGLLATATASNWWAVTLLRGFTGLGFGFVLIFAQTLMLRLGRESGRAGAIAEFVGAVVAAGICGPVLGGLVAVKLGTPWALAAAGLCALVALALAGQVATPPSGAEQAGFPLSLRSLKATLGNRRLLMLLGFSAIPGKLAATAVLLMVVPLAVAEMGESPSLAGRLLLLYFLGFLLVAGTAGRLSDRWKARKPFVAVGGVVTAAGCLAGYGVGGVWGLVLLCTLTGLGQAWLSSPQIVLATQLANEKAAGVDGEVVLGIYRLIERLGGALGPVLAAHLIERHGLPGAQLALGLLLAGGSAAVAVSFGWWRSAPVAATENPA
jgi:MFS family permease